MAGAGTPSHEAATEEERWEQKLDSELAAFERLRPALLKTHRGLFVAIHHGAVIDADTDGFRLAAKTEERATREGPIAICQVLESDEGDREADPIFHAPPMEERGW